MSKFPQQGRSGVQIESWPRSALLAVAILLMAVVGVLDYVTGIEVEFYFFYLIPIGFIAWLTDLRLALKISVLAAATWFGVDFVSVHPYQSKWTPYWNALTQLSVFATVAYLSARLRAELAFHEESARTDSLTRIGNRRAFLERAEIEIAHCRRFGQPLGVAFIDLDDFKKVNDTFGHDVGDEVLLTVASALRDGTRATDFVARLGGDEFVVLLAGLGSEAVEPMLRELSLRVAAAISARSWKVTASVGAVTFLHPADDPREMLKAADALLYEAKRAGKNGIVHEIVRGGLSEVAG